MKVLSIQIPTIAGREAQFDALFEALNNQAKGYPVSVIFLKDNKEMTIGAKRQRLAEMADAKYMVQVDDDDSLAPDFVETIFECIAANPDCIGYLENINANGAKVIAAHTDRCLDWANHQLGFAMVRTIFCKDVIKTEHVLKVGFDTSLRFGEDHDFARRLKASGLLQKEVFIKKEMYFYNAPVLNNQNDRNTRYGIQ